MKHFSTEKWIDFVNQVVSASERKPMQEHLEQGCKRCAATVSLWEKVQRSAATEGNYQPPANVVRIAKAAFASAGSASPLKQARKRIVVLFDSFLQPALAGARSAATGTRQMLYRADPFQLDVQIEAKSGGNQILVSGQLLDSNAPAIMCDGVGVVLSNMRGNTVHVVTNKFGEFSGEVENSGDLQMSFTIAGDKPIVISLRDALGQMPKRPQ